MSDTLRTAAALREGDEPGGTEQRAALAAVLLERHGVVTRDAVVAENVRGGFGAVYPVYREMEERGRVRRGYFVEGLGGAQFSIAGAVDRLRSMRRDAGAEHSREPRTVLLAAADPANPYGAALAWPRDETRHERSPSRSAGAYVVLHDGELVLYLERGGRSLLTFAPFDDEGVAAAAVEALRGLLADSRFKRLQLARVDGTAVGESAHRARLAALGFREAYKGLRARAVLTARPRCASPSGVRRCWGAAGGSALGATGSMVSPGVTSSPKKWRPWRRPASHALAARRGERHHAVSAPATMARFSRACPGHVRHSNQRGWAQIQGTAAHSRRM